MTETQKKYALAKRACYITGVCMAITANLSPLLFVTFRNMYGMSYTLLGFLVVINFVTQLMVDLVFAFFTKHFNIHKSVKSTPLVMFLGLVLYSVMPLLFPKAAVVWIMAGTVMFSVASGLAEVLLSPVIAAVPSDNPEGEMSKLHSMYAWGVVGVVLVSTLFMKLFGQERWPFLALMWSAVPLSAFLMFLRAELPPMQIGGGGEKKGKKAFPKGVLLCVACIFFGGAAECTMSQWASGFVENALGVSKVAGDVFGVAVFALLLAAGRTLYARFGRNIINILLAGMIGAAVCYIAAGFAMSPAVGIVACALTGIFVSMLWPGTLIYAEEKVANLGVAAYALMAAGGDIGASIAPQIVGIVSDKLALGALGARLSAGLGITAEQVGMRGGLLSAALFPLAGAFVILYMKRYFRKH